MDRRVLVLELNELCPPLLERFMAAGDLPSFSRLRAESTAYITEAEEPQDHLNPWIQWVTAHTGVGFEQHGIFKLGEGSRSEHPTIADAVTSAGGSVWLCGPMNVVPKEPVRGRWLPDPWNPDDEAGAAELSPFVRFVRANVQEHTNAAHRMSPGQYASFLWFMLRHGLRPGTTVEVLRQLAGERVGRRARWRRAALLDRFQWDLFLWVQRRERPNLSTYFSNTTAHYQHMYWRYMDPTSFDLVPTEEEVATFGGAIRSGYIEMDRIVREALDLADETDATLVFCTAISQQPYVLKEAVGGSRFYRPRDIAAFVDSLGFAGVRSVAPVMAAQFHVFFDDEVSASAAEKALTLATVAGRRAFDLRRVGPDLFMGFSPTDDLPADAAIEAPFLHAPIPVGTAFYRSETAKSGYHHPDGALWIRSADQRGDAETRRVPLRSVAATLLSLLEVERLPSMAPAVAGPSA